MSILILNSLILSTANFFKIYTLIFEVNLGPSFEFFHLYVYDTGYHTQLTDELFVSFIQV